MTATPAPGRALELVARPALPEHGWNATHGPVTSFDGLPRFVRALLLLMIEARMIKETLLVVASLAGLSFLCGISFWKVALLLIPAAAIVPVRQLRFLMSRQLGPYHLRVVDVNAATALSRREAPRTFLHKIELALMWRGVVALFVVFAGVLAFLLAGITLTEVIFRTGRDVASPSIYWFVALLPWMVLLEGVVVNWLVTSTLRIETQTHCLRFVA